MSGNEREYEISAPNRHSRTGGNPTPGNVRFCPLADEYCDQCEESVSQDETPPVPSGLFEKLPGKSTLRQYVPAVFNYLNDCRWSPCLPHTNRILSSSPPRPSNAAWYPGPMGSQPEATPGRSLPNPIGTGPPRGAAIRFPP